MPKTCPPYAAEFRRQMADLVRTRRDPADLACEFEPSAQAIRNWVVQAGFAVSVMVHVLGVFRAGHYAWLRCGPCPCEPKLTRHC